MASDRPYSYWVWADLAAGSVAVGPSVTAALGPATRLVRRWRACGPTALPPTVLLAGGALLAVAAATLSGLSKSEVERIWLPFLLWLVPLTAHLPATSRRGWLLASSAWAVGVTVLLRTTW